MANTRVDVPATAKRGDIIDIRTLVSHTMETGQSREINEQHSKNTWNMWRLDGLSFLRLRPYAFRIQPGLGLVS